MKNTSITLFTIACAAYAKPLGQDQRFSSHAAQYNVEIKTAEQYRERQRIFSENDAIIEETNRKADESGSSQALRLAHNFTSTMTEDEINNMMGLCLSKCYEVHFGQVSKWLKSIFVNLFEYHCNKIYGYGISILYNILTINVDSDRNFI